MSFGSEKKYIVFFVTIGRAPFFLFSFFCLPVVVLLYYVYNLSEKNKFCFPLCPHHGLVCAAYRHILFIRKPWIIFYNIMARERRKKKKFVCQKRPSTCTRDVCVCFFSLCKKNVRKIYERKNASRTWLLLLYRVFLRVRIIICLKKELFE